MATETHQMTISGPWLAAHIRSLMDSGKVALAFKTASSLSANSITSDERAILAFNLMFGLIDLEDGEGGMATVERDDRDVCELLEKLFDRMENEKAEMERALDLAYRKLNAIYDSLIDSDPSALRHASAYWSEERREGDPFLFEDDTLIDTYTLAEDAMGKDSPLASYLKANAPEHEDKPTYGWLSPEGEFHPVDWAQHGRWAEAYLRDKGIDAPYPGDELVRRGWILIHDPAHGVGKCTMNAKVKPTLAQKQFLIDYYLVWEEELAADAVKHNYYHEVPHLFDLIDVD